jgi:hypothetical protein
MQTGLTIDDDALARRQACRKHVAPGQAASEAVRRGVRRPVATSARNKLLVA